MKQLLKAFIVVGVILIVASLGGRAMNTLETTVTSEQLESGEAQARIVEHRRKSDFYKWIGVTGGVLVLGARLGQRFMAR